MSLAGIVITVASLAADLLTGSDVHRFGSSQMLGCLAGIGILAVGVVSWKAPQLLLGASFRWALSIYVAAASFVLSAMSPAADATLILLAYVAAICIVLPVTFGILTFAGIIAAATLMGQISKIKADLIGMPLTMLDIRIALANPSGLWDAVGLAHWTRYGATTLLLLAALGWIAAGVTAGRRLGKPLDQHRAIDLTTRLVVLISCCALIYFHFETLAAKASSDDSTWAPERVARLVDQMGVLPFLAYTHRLESKVSGDIFRSRLDVGRPSAQEIRRAVVEHIDFGDQPTQQSTLAPNILVVLAESTFNPGAVFRLVGKWNKTLFQPGDKTASSGLLRVNAVGGGTWISEFETIVGMDSRWFGYVGMYTHASLSPLINQSFASYLGDRGYRTWAFFPNLGNFYNSRNAYVRYGFDNVLDSRDLGQGDWVEDDRQVAKSVRDVLGSNPEAPFFAYVVFLENHAPHNCDTNDPLSFSTRFVNSDDFEPNCTLHEYLRRLDSTTEAVDSLIQYLDATEAQTGRPFILMVFGDHQPHTFSSTGGIQYDYSGLRRLADTHLTFYHIYSSVPGRTLRCCDAVPPATLLPTLVSGLIAESADDVYLGVNLWLYDHCGSNALHWDFGESLGRTTKRDDPTQIHDCSHAYHRALAWYRSSGIVRLGGG